MGRKWSSIRPTLAADCKHFEEPEAGHRFFRCKHDNLRPCAYLMKACHKAEALTEVDSKA